jgi:2-methylcitrate dehydratase PrpD
LRNKPGMHVDAGWPSLAVAAGVARLLDCSADEGYAALQTVACQIPVGLYAPARAGSTARNTYLAHAVAAGMLGALAIAAGIDAPPDGLDECARIVFDLDPAAAQFAPVGEYLLLQNYLKPFAAVRHVHYGATAALALRDQCFMRLGDITKIELDIYPEALTYCGNRAPTTMIGAQFSLTYGLAAALRFGDLSPAVYRDGQFNEVGVRRLEALVQTRAEPVFGEGGQRVARLRIHLPNEVLERAVSSVKGDHADPFTPQDCATKFVRYAGEMGTARADHFADALLTGDNAQSVRTLWKELMSQ